MAPARAPKKLRNLVADCSNVNRALSAEPRLYFKLMQCIISQTSNEGIRSVCAMMYNGIMPRMHGYKSVPQEAPIADASDRWPTACTRCLGAGLFHWLSHQRSIIAVAVLLAIGACSGSRQGSSPYPVMTDTARVNENVPLELSEPLYIRENRRLESQCIRVSTPSDDGAIIIDRDDVILEFNQAEIRGDTVGVTPQKYAGRGIVIRGARNVTIRGARVRGFRVGIYAEDAPNLVIENCDVSDNFRERLQSTPFQEQYADWIWPHRNDENEWLRYGAGIYLLRCDNAKLTNNRARRTQNGICLASCRQARVESNDMSHLSGWGLALWRSTQCRILGNRFDYCVRGYSHNHYARGQDSAGILIFEQCSDNILAFNSATHGGDGLFLYGGEETLRKTGEGGSSRNLFYENDFSHAAVNGIETTFSDLNVFLKQRIVDCRHGVWGGYSTRTRFIGCEFDDSHIGASIEHARDTLISHSRFTRSERGVHLYWDEDEYLKDVAYVRHQGADSSKANLSDVYFEGCGTAVSLDRTTDVTISDARFRSCERVLLAKGDTTFSSIGTLYADGGILVNDTEYTIKVDRLIQYGDVPLQGDFHFNDKQLRTVDQFGLDVVTDQDVSKQLDTSAYLRTAALQVIDAAAWDELHRWRDANSDAPGLRMIRNANSKPGRASIIIGRYGPACLDEMDVFDMQPETFTAGQHAIIRWSSPGFEYTSSITEGDVTVSPSQGRTPVLIAVTPRKGIIGVHPFELRLSTSERSFDLRGVFVSTRWDVAYFTWDEGVDPRVDEAWRDMIAAEPEHRDQLDQLDFIWGLGAAFPGGPRERFGVVATTGITLPAGRWRIRTLSDDGVRVHLDDHTIIDNWTWHVATENTAEFDAPGGVEHRIRVEYFELTGNALLQVTIEPADNPQEVAETVENAH